MRQRVLTRRQKCMSVQVCCLSPLMAVLEACRIWFSPEFKVRHSSLAQLLDAATKWPGSCWTMAVNAQSSDVVLTTTAGVRAARRAFGATRARTGHDLLTDIAKIDLEATGGTF